MIQVTLLAIRSPDLDHRIHVAKNEWSNDFLFVIDCIKSDFEIKITSEFFLTSQA